MWSSQRHQILWYLLRISNRFACTESGSVGTIREPIRWCCRNESETQGLAIEGQRRRKKKKYIWAFVWEHAIWAWVLK